MSKTNYNGEGRWNRAAILERYEQLAAEMRVAPRDLSPMEHSDGDRFVQRFRAYFESAARART